MTWHKRLWFREQYLDPQMTVSLSKSHMIQSLITFLCQITISIQYHAYGSFVILCQLCVMLL